MEQFCQMGEVLGGLQAQMVLRDENQINARQCTLLFELYNQAFNTIAEDIKHYLKVEEKATKWQPLEQPLRDLVRVFKEGDSYIKSCSEGKKSWWARAVCFHNSRVSVEYHIHNLLLYFPMAIEAIETVAEVSGLDLEEMNKKRMMLASKYHKMWNDPKLFQWKYGKKYLVDDEILSRQCNALMEDKWLLAEVIKRKKTGHPSSALTKYEQHIGDLLIKRLEEPDSLCSSSTFVAAKDYQVRRRIDKAGQYKEIQWLGEGLVLRRFFADDHSLDSEIRQLLSLSHPNVVRYLCGFHDEEKNEYFLVAEQMVKDLNSYIKETCGVKRRVPLPLPVAVDIMLQVARGMEYLHSQKIYHGNLNPSNVLVKVRNSTPEGYVHAKITGFDLKSIGSGPFVGTSVGQDEALAFIWNAPEVMNEQEKPESDGIGIRDTKKADVYSFAMLSFQVLTGKVPFEDSHLKGEKMSRNIRAGERPLFPFALPKHLATLIKRCWQADPTQRPSFSSICRILRYMTRVMVMNPQFAYPMVSMPQVDVCDIEAKFLKKFPQQDDIAPVTHIPFELFSFRLVEMDKLNGPDKNQDWESASEGTLVKDADENNIIADKDFFATHSDSEDRKEPSVIKSNTKADNSVLASGVGRILQKSRSMCITDSSYDRELSSLCQEVIRNKPTRLQKTTSGAEHFSTAKKDSPLQKSKSLRTAKDPGISRAAARLSLHKPPGSLEGISEQGHSKASSRRASSVFRRPGKN